MLLLHRIVASAAAFNRQQRWFLFWVVAGMAILGWLAVPGPRAAKATARIAENHAAGNPAGTMDYVAHWIPRAGCIGLVGGALLLVGMRWLVRPVPGSGLRISPVPQRQGKGLMVFTAAIMLYSAVANAPRLDFSLWGDEGATVRKSVVGQFVRDSKGVLQWDGVSWPETVFRYRDPNNHPLNSVLARLSHSAFSGDLTDPEGFYFDERALRLPVFAAGLLGLAALAWVGWVLGKPLLGGAAVLLLAIHPWFVRYGVEARGYGLLLLFTPLAVGCLVRAASTGRWRWWVGYGLAQFLILWSYPGAVHLLVALNMSALCLLFGVRGPSRAWRQAQTGRWVTACVLGAVLSLIMLLPLVQPLMFYLKSDRMQGPMPASWYPDAIAWLVTGMPWRAWDAASPLCWSWEQAVPEALSTPALIGMGIGLAIGAAGWWVHGGLARCLLPALGLHAPLFLLQTKMTAGFVYPWYLQPALPGIVLLSSGILLFPFRQSLPGILAWLAFLILPTRNQVQLLREYPVEESRGGTKLTRTISLPSDPRIEEVMTIDVFMTSRAYDPATLPLTSDDVDLFTQYLGHADASGKPLFVHFGSPGLAAELRPKVMAVILNPGLFSEIATFPGLDSPFIRKVFRYRAGSWKP